MVVRLGLRESRRGGEWGIAAAATSIYRPSRDRRRRLICCCPTEVRPHSSLRPSITSPLVLSAMVLVLAALCKETEKKSRGRELEVVHRRIGGTLRKRKGGGKNCIRQIGAVFHNSFFLRTKGLLPS